MKTAKIHILTAKEILSSCNIGKSFLLSVIIVLFPLLFSNTINAQSKDDVALLKNHSFENKEFKEREVTYGFQNTKTKGVVYHVLSSSMYVYQKCLSPVVSRSCGFTPSCSAYSKELIRNYGLFKGVVCTTDRLMRCNKVAFAGKSLDYFDIKIGKHSEDVDIYSAKPTNFIGKPQN